MSIHDVWNLLLPHLPSLYATHTHTDARAQVYPAFVSEASVCPDVSLLHQQLCVCIRWWDSHQFGLSSCCVYACVCVHVCVRTPATPVLNHFAEHKENLIFTAVMEHLTHLHKIPTTESSESNVFFLLF